MGRLDTEEAEARRRRWQRELARGKTLAQIARAEGISRQAAHEFLGGVPDGGKREAQHFHVRKSSFDRAIALIKKQFDLVTRTGKKAGKGSVGMFIEQVGEGRIVCRWNDIEEPDAETPSTGEAPL